MLPVVPTQVVQAALNVNLQLVEIVEDHLIVHLRNRDSVAGHRDTRVPAIIGLAISLVDENGVALPLEQSSSGGGPSPDWST